MFKHAQVLGADKTNANLYSQNHFALTHFQHCSIYGWDFLALYRLWVTKEKKEKSVLNT
jgi:hypothetical protein